MSKLKEALANHAEHCLGIARACKDEMKLNGENVFLINLMKCHVDYAEQCIKMARAESDLENTVTMTSRQSVPAFSVDPMFARLVAIDEDDPNMRNLYL
jgi:hypothetical protein